MYMALAEEEKKNAAPTMQVCFPLAPFPSSSAGVEVQANIISVRVLKNVMQVHTPAEKKVSVQRSFASKAQ